jgi:Protein of unknown function DUF2625
MKTRKLEELVLTNDPAIELLKQLVRDAAVPCELLPPGQERENALLYLQVTTRSTLGALAYDTGGLIIDDGWLRFLGSGHPKLPRTLHEWNSTRTDGAFYLVGDDAAGGFFALNGGAFGDDMGSVYYWAPDNLEWEPLNRGFTDIVAAFLTGHLRDFYTSLRWSTWREDTQKLSGDQCFFFFPFLWTREGSPEGSARSVVPMSEAWDSKVEIVTQLGGG